MSYLTMSDLSNFEDAYARERARTGMRQGASRHHRTRREMVGGRMAPPGFSTIARRAGSEATLRPGDPGYYGGARAVRETRGGFVDTLKRAFGGGKPGKRSDPGRKQYSWHDTPNYSRYDGESVSVVGRARVLDPKTGRYRWKYRIEEPAAIDAGPNRYDAPSASPATPTRARRTITRARATRRSTQTLDRELAESRRREQRARYENRMYARAMEQGWSDSFRDRMIARGVPADRAKALWEIEKKRKPPRVPAFAPRETSLPSGTSLPGMEPYRPSTSIAARQATQARSGVPIGLPARSFPLRSTTGPVGTQYTVSTGYMSRPFTQTGGSTVYRR